MTRTALILAAAIIIGGFLAGGRYTVASGGSGVFGGVVVDRFTGATSLCTIGGCTKLENSN